MGIIEAEQKKQLTIGSYFVLLHRSIFKEYDSANQAEYET